jgi:thiamine biosynthesis lipoprotein
MNKQAVSLFYKLSLVLILLCSILISGEAQSVQRYEYQEKHMGTLFRIVLYAETQSSADSSANNAFQRIAELNTKLSDYLPDSELNCLSASSGSGKKVKVSKDLYRVLKISKRWSRRSDGAFDVTIGPLSKLWRRAFRQQAFPDSTAVAEALQKVNYRWVKCSVFSQKVKLKKAGMRLDLGGIAKGYAIDEAMKVLQKMGIRHALVDGGGDILFTDPPPDDSENYPGTQSRRSPTDPAWILQTPSGDTLRVAQTAVATSGDTYRFLEHHGKRYSHIINPKTGYGITESRPVTIMAPNCTAADALASTLSIIDRKKMKRWNRKWKIVKD